DLPLVVLEEAVIFRRACGFRRAHVGAAARPIERMRRISTTPAESTSRPRAMRPHCGMVGTPLAGENRSTCFTPRNPGSRLWTHRPSSPAGWPGATIASEFWIVGAGGLPPWSRPEAVTDVTV